MAICVYDTYMRVSAEAEMGVGSPGARVRSCFELLDVGARN